MEVYKFKCNCCGSTRCEKLPDGYKCKYCGNIQDIIFSKEEEKQPEPEEIKVTVQAKQDDVKEKETISPINKPAFKQALINFIICLLGGWFGLHKFIKGEIFWGIVYACTGGFFGIGYILDCVFGFFEMLGSLKAGEE